MLLEAGAIVAAKMEYGKSAADKALEMGFVEIAKILSYQVRIILSGKQPKLIS